MDQEDNDTTKRENLILDTLLVYLFQAFTELSIVFSSDKEIYKKLLVSMNSNIDFKSVLNEFALDYKKQNIKFSKDDIDLLRKLSQNIVRIHQIAKGVEDSISAIPMMKNYNLTDNEMLFVKECTVNAIELMKQEI